MSAMAANMCVATSVQIAVEREKPAEKDSSGGDDRFSNMLSQRQPDDDAKPMQRAAPKPKSAEPAKSKDDEPDDTLKLLQTSTAIQPSVTPPPQTPSATQTPTTDTAVDDVLAKSAGKTAPQPLITTTAGNGAQAASGTPLAATAPVTGDTPAQADATAQIAQLLQQTAAPTEKPVVDSAAAKLPATSAPSSDQKKVAMAQPGTPSTRTPDLSAPAPTPTDAASSKTAEATPTIQAPVAPLPTNAAPPADSPQLAQQTNVPQPLAMPATQLDFSNAAPSVSAAAVAAAATPRAMLRETKDNSLDPIDATAPTGATPSFALPEHRDIATVDGKVPVPAPSSPQFGDALGAKLSWMAERHIGHAEIRLSPDDLGTIDVRVRLNGDHVRAEFNSANAEVRQAINSHLPRLRDMLSQHGFNLAESHVGNGSNQRSGQNASSDSLPAPVEDEIALPAPRITTYTHNGLLNTFA
jgi:flagellar hook-length control protein FliK